jgi:hypothetical protein
MNGASVKGRLISPADMKSAAAIALVALLASTQPAKAESTIYHVRPDGGNALQCTGMSDRPYPGQGTSQSCAWQHPFIALPPGGEPRIPGGSTLIIGQGDYRMGIGAPGAEACHQDQSRDCHMPPLPSGPDSDTPTRLLGVGHDNGCEDPPQLWGSDGVAMVINLDGTSHAQLSCLEITDRSSCIVSHCHAGNCPDDIIACETGPSPSGAWASVGIRASDSVDVSLNDLHIHGLARNGIQAGRIGDWRLDRVRIIANGWAGWDGSIGADSSNHGTLQFTDVEIAWNGCSRTWPEGDIEGCWAESTGGYGDGLGTAQTGGHWHFERVSVHHNTSDGLDLLYLDGGASVTINASLFEGNAGNQVKISGSARISNSIIVGNCAGLEEHANILESDLCRAGGDAVFLGLGEKIDSTMVGNTVTGQGNCLVSAAGATGGGRLAFSHNLFVGQQAQGRSGRSTCLFYTNHRGADISWQSNVMSNVHRGVCTGDNRCVQSVGILNPDIDRFDPTPLDASVLFTTTSPDEALLTDFWGRPRPQDGGMTIGAIEAAEEPDFDPPDLPQQADPDLPTLKRELLDEQEPPGSMKRDLLDEPEPPGSQ